MGEREQVLSPLTPLSVDFFRRPADVVAPELLGRYLIRQVGGHRLTVRIVEMLTKLGRFR